MQHEHRFLVPHRVDGAEGAAFIVLDDFQHAGAAEALERLGGAVLLAVLREMQRMPEEPANVDGKRHQVLLAAAEPLKRLLTNAGHARIYQKRSGVRSRPHTELR